jgi:uncharacterized protein
MINPIEIINEFYTPNSKAYRITVRHGEQVARKSLEAAARVPHLNPDLRFIEEAAMLHDIAVFMTDSPELGCFGEHFYFCHGYLGRILLEKKGLPRHALVCERHVGVGMTAEDMKRQRIPLPLYDMVPVSIEEQIICYADKFFSKSGEAAFKEKSVKAVREGLERYGHDKAMKFQAWAEMFE